MSGNSGKSVIALGECMLELSRTTASSSAWRLHSGGDTFNALIYLARLGFDAHYMTALGNDHFSNSMREEWQAEGVATDMVLTHPTRVPGLYAISLDENGERSFTYWRSESAARALFDCPGIEQAMRSAASAELLFVSGITLAIFDDAAQSKIVSLARQVRANGGKVAFDVNYRAPLWQQPTAARRAFDRLIPEIDIAMPSIEDQQAIYGDTEATAAIQRWKSMGVTEVVIKQSSLGATVGFDGAIEHVKGREVNDVRDTTGAGDGFNAGYLAGRLAGRGVIEAAAAGHLLASAVVRHAGAVIPRVTMPLGLPKNG